METCCFVLHCKPARKTQQHAAAGMHSPAGRLAAPNRNKQPTHAALDGPISMTCCQWSTACTASRSCRPPPSVTSSLGQPLARVIPAHASSLQVAVTVRTKGYTGSEPERAGVRTGPTGPGPKTRSRVA
jgi:hypothetical protein